MKLKKKWLRLTSQERIYNLEIPIIAITGGIATGKSTFCDFLKQDGLPLIDADQIIKEIYAETDSVSLIQKLSPESVKDNEIDFKVLRKIFFENDSIKKEIEDYLFKQFPLYFINQVNNLKSDFIFYDVPLLFEKKLHKDCDVSCLIYVPKELQISRLIARDNITVDLAQTILQNQLPIDEKKKLSMLIVDNQGTKKELENNYRQFKDLLFI